MPLNPEAPRPPARQRAVTAVRTAAYRRRSDLEMVACGGAFGAAALLASGSLAVAAGVTIWFLVGVYLNRLATRVK